MEDERNLWTVLKVRIVGTDGERESVRRRRMLRSRATVSEIFLSSSLSGRSGELFYLDDENDRIKITTDEELAEAMRIYPDILRLDLVVLREEEDKERYVFVGKEETGEGELAAATKCAEIDDDDVRIRFKVNDKDVAVPSDVPATTKLVSFLRENLGLCGTKISCGEGGCGACAVLMRWTDASGKVQTRSVNACLRPLALCQDVEIFTVEGMGSAAVGYSEVQSCIANGNGSQCGFCTPGMVMAMHGLLAEKKDAKSITAKDVETRFDGNLCRCTGYRPILQSFRKLIESKHSGASKEATTSSSSRGRHAELAASKRAPLSVFRDRDGPTWLRPTTLSDLCATLLDRWSKKVPVHVAGAFTGVNGVYRSLKIDTPLDADTSVVVLSEVPDLSEVSVGKDAIVFGASVTIQELHEAVSSIDALDALSYASSRVASHHVRNVGTWAGNVMMTFRIGFPSDLVTALIACGASVDVLSSVASAVERMTLWDFLRKGADWCANVLLVRLSVPVPSTDRTVLRFCKAAARGQNSHSLLNGGFRCVVNATNDGLSDVVIVYGAVNTTAPVRATKTEALLADAKALDADLLKRALDTLETEIKVEPESAYRTADCPGGKKLAYRKSLVSSFFYKFFVGLLEVVRPTDVPADAKSAGARMYTERPLTEAQQAYSVNADMKPVNEPHVKLSALKQASGEAVYTDDIPVRDVLHAAFVGSTAARCTLASIDTSRALAMRDVVAFVGADDVPGSNDCSAFTCAPRPNTVKITPSQPIFVPLGGDVVFYGQPIGMIVASTREAAEAGARAVSATFKADPSGPPLITIDDAIAKKSFYSTDFDDHVHASGDVDAAMKTADHVVTGTVRGGGMRHFYMEKQSTLAVPDETRVHVHCASQGIDLVRMAVAASLGRAGSDVTVSMRRAGGSFGGKITGATQPSCAVAIAAAKLGKPVRLQNDIYTDHKTTGGRHPVLANYTVGFASDGTITALDIDGYLDGGAIMDATYDTCSEFALSVDGCYAVKNWRCTTTPVFTHTQPNASIRGPGQVPGAYVCERIVERVATECGLDPVVVRERNFYTKRNCITPFNQPMSDSFSLPQVWARLGETADLEKRAAAIASFNKANRWRKRALSVAPVKYSTFNWPASNGIVAVNADGSVNIQHGHAEIGQGIHTRVAQVCAYTLGCPLSCVRVVDSCTDLMPNMPVTGGSVSTGSASEAIRLACLRLKRRLAPIVESLGPDVVTKARSDVASWVQICAAANAGGIDLLSTGRFRGPPGSKTDLAQWAIGLDGAYHTYPCAYFNFGAGCSEVEIDVLTGEHSVLRTDIVYDCGQSLNQALDIGQVEGAFTMGMGWYTREEMLYASDGSMMSDGTWEYKPPCTMDVPIDLRVELLKNSTFNKGVLRSKAVGEPPKILSYTIFEAIKRAIAASRIERGLSPVFDLNVPATVSAIKDALDVSAKDLTLA